MSDANMGHNAAATADLSARVLRLAILILLCVFVLAVVLVTYIPVLGTQAQSFDDEQYWVNNRVVHNPGWASIGLFFKEVFHPSTVSGYYQPLTMTSLMADWALGGRPENMTPFHVTSLCLHLSNTVLIIVFLYVLFGNPWAAALVGLLFGVHPLTVEPIPWVSERKTLLAAFFSLWCLVFYVGYARRSSWSAYGLALAAFVLALLCKPTATPMPLLLLLLDFWPLKRLSRRAVLDKLPFLGIAGISAVITYFSQAVTAGAQPLPSQYPAWLTFCHNLVFYLYKIVWPHNLTSHYPYPEPFNLSHPMLLAGVIGTPLIVVAVLVSLRWTRAVAVGTLFFLLAILPTMGLVGFSNVIASDKFVYLPAVGLLLILAYGLVQVWQAGGRGSGGRRAVAIVAVVVLGGLEIWGTRGYLTKWKDTVTLYSHMLTFAPQSQPLHDRLGRELYKLGQREVAAEHFKAAMGNTPFHSDAWNNYGMYLADQNRLTEAIPYFVQAIRLDPNHAQPYANLGRALTHLDPNDPNNMLLAQRHLERATQLDPHAVDAYNSLGVLFAMKGQLEDAERQFRKALEIDPRVVSPYLGLGRVYIAQEKLNEAVRVLETAENVAPQDQRVKGLLEYARARRNPPASP